MRGIVNPLWGLKKAVQGYGWRRLGFVTLYLVYHTFWQMSIPHRPCG